MNGSQEEFPPQEEYFPPVSKLGQICTDCSQEFFYHTLVNRCARCSRIYRYGVSAQ